jgi:hypothetical protein
MSDCELCENCLIPIRDGYGFTLETYNIHVTGSRRTFPGIYYCELCVTVAPNSEDMYYLLTIRDPKLTDTPGQKFLFKNQFKTIGF